MTAGLFLFALALMYAPPSRRAGLVSADVSAPGATPLQDGARPQPVVVEFSGPVARLDRVGKEAVGLRLEPAARGQWRWESDRRLSFAPADEWPVGAAYRLRLTPAALAPGVKLASRDLTFLTSGFSGGFVSGDFSVDPKDAAIKRVSATLQFSHPVDQDDLEKRLTLELVPGERGLLEKPRRVSFKVALDKLGGKAFVTSQPLEIPEKDAVLRLRLAAGARSWRGGAGLREPLELAVRVPGRYALLSIAQARLEIVRDEASQEPKQALLVEASAGVDDGPMAAAVSAWVLPEELPAIQDRPAQKDIRYWSPSMIGPEVLSLSTHAALSPMPSENEHALTHAFSLRAPPKRWLYVTVDRGLEAYGGYALGRGFSTVLQVPEYPKQLKILHDGAVLSSAGRRALSLAAEGVPRVRFELGRVLPGRVSLLASQSGGEFSHPAFMGGGFGADDLTERFEQLRTLPGAEPGKVSYFSFDFSPYMSGRHGLFFFTAESWDDKKKRGREPRDHRLILVTDLGLVVKDNADGSHDVFVQRLSSGKPAGGARVEILGRNGLPSVAASADESGRAHFPDLKDLKREKQPVAYLAKLDDDVSFLPFSRGDRRLDFSRFDVGGVYTEGKKERLEAFLFTDRGLYRPGDTIHAAALVRASDWTPAPGTPLEAVVTDPRGLEVQKTKVALSTAAFEELAYRTQENGLTGGYTLSLYTVKDARRAALLGSATARVEEFLPDRLRIRTRLSSERDEGWVSPQDLRGYVSLKTLYGSDAEGRRVAARVELTPAEPRFKSYAGFRFFDPAAAKKGFSESLDEAVTDAQGEASFPLDLTRFAAATYRLTFSAQGFEAGSGRGVGSESTVIVSPRPYLVGIKADGNLDFVRRGSTRAVEAAAVGPAGQGLAAASLRLELIETRHVSALVKQENGLYKYQSVERQVLVSSRALSLPAAGARLPLWTARPGDFALVVRDGDGLELNRARYAVAGSADVSRSLERNAELQIGVEKPDYAPGEEVAVRLRAPYSGAGLITIERDRVYAHKWFRAGTSASIQTIRLPEAVEGNAYVNVQFLRAPDSPEIFMSPLSYGVAPFTVSRARRSLPLRLEAPETIRPGQTLRVRYKTGRRARVAVWIVDEGILQAAGYRTPDPLGFFYRKRALEVRTYQLLDLLLPELAAARSSPGGDKGAQALGRNLNPFKRKTEPPVAYWSGLRDGGEDWSELTWTVPESFSGSLRVMAVGASPAALGAAEARLVARSPLVLQPSAPLFAAPGDEFELSVSLSNGVAGSGPDAKATLAIEPSGHLEAVGPRTVALAVPEARERSATFRLRAKPALGSASVRVTANIGEERVGQTVTLSVRPASPREVTLAGGLLRAGSSATADVRRRLFPQYRELEASVSALPLVLARALLPYLRDYPHGCTEQLVSQALPALLLATRPDFGYAPEQASAAVDRALAILRARQNAEGAFGYWAANSDYDVEASLYALHFLIEARDRGVPLAPDMLARGAGFLERAAEGGGGVSATARQRAYAIYLLTRQGRVTTDLLETLRREVESDESFKRDIGAAYMAAAYKQVRLDGLADRWIRAIELSKPVETQCDYSYFYDSPARNAQLLYIWAKHFPGRVRRMSEDDWRLIVDPIVHNQFNTHSAGYSILAFDAAADSSARTDVRAADDQRRALVWSGELFKRATFAPSAASVRFDNQGDGPAFYAAVQSGFDLEPPAAVRREKLEIVREYLDASGKAVSSARVGDEITVRLRLRALGQALPRVAVVDLLPGGLEASAERGQAATGAWLADYVDVREDRVVGYGTAQPDSADILYKARATARGRFAAPPAYAESMYDRSARARTLPSVFEVR